jgi:adenylate cyclase
LGGSVVLTHSKICKGCWQQLHLPVPLRGPASVPFRAFGIRPSRMNPNTCTFCELMFSKIMRASKITIDATIVFADLRGYTSLSRQHSAEQVTSLLDDFYEECGAAIWEHDGLLNKIMGDAVMAVFNFPIKQEDHTVQALQAARKIRERWSSKRAIIAERIGAAGDDLGMGIGIDCGEVSFGEFGRSHLDLTAIGNVVNTASRAQSVALGDEILVTPSVHHRLSELADSRGQTYQLKGFDTPIMLFAA